MSLPGRTLDNVPQREWAYDGMLVTTGRDGSWVNVTTNAGFSVSSSAVGY